MTTVYNIANYLNAKTNAKTTEPELTERFQIALSTHRDAEIRQELAEMNGICEEAQENLAADEDPDVLEALAQNPTVSEDALGILAENEYLNEEIMVILANSKFDTVRYQLAQNPKICEEAQAILIDDKDEEVVEALIENSNFDKTVFLTRKR